MSTRKTLGLSLLRTLCIGLGLLGLALPGLTQTPTFTLLHSFGRGKDGAFPYAGLVQATDGFFYGTTENGGNYTEDWNEGFGTIFRIGASGSEKVLYRFLPGWNSDAVLPVADLIQGTDGNFYGTSNFGGANGYGAVFKVTPAGVETVLHSFNWYSDGACPLAALVQGSDGNFYGTTSQSGGWGTVFTITPHGFLTTLYAFNGSPSDGADPWTSLIQACDGNFYGTTYRGGAYGPNYGGGTVYKVTPDGAESVLHEFGNGLDGLFPAAALIQATDGNFYGTTSEGGVYNKGTIFKITPEGEETVLHSFAGYPIDGADPEAGLIQGYDGSFYGTTNRGGANGGGTVFKITPDGAETVLYSFTWNSDGAYPYAALTEGTDGNFYGTTSIGGPYNGGTVFRLSGVYPLPLTSISPGACNAGDPAFTLTAKGTGFQSFTTIHWNGSPLATTYVSSSVLKATVPASLIATPGAARITVVTGGGPSNAKKFTIKLTTLKLASATLTKNSATGAYTANISLKNIGYLTASDVMITKATLGAATTATPLPVTLDSIDSGSMGNAGLAFPSSAGTAGTVVVLKVLGTFTGGTFSGSLKITLP